MLKVQDFTGTIVEILDMTPTVKLFRIELDKEIDFKAGQFVNLIFEFDGKRVMKPYSVASGPGDKKIIELCIKLVPEGRVTPFLFEQEIGFQMRVKGPLGMFTLEHSQREKIVLIGTGTGVSPLRSMVREMIDNNIEKEITLVFGVRYEKEILFEKEFEALQMTNPNFRFIKLVSRPSEQWEGRTGYVHQNFDIVDTQNSDFFICGLPEMVNASKEKLINMGVAKENIHLERYV